MHYLSAQATVILIADEPECSQRGAEETQEFRVELDKTELTRQAGFQKTLSKAPVTPALFFARLFPIRP